VLRDHLSRLVTWAVELAKGEARQRRAGGEHAISRALFRLAKELRRRSSEVVPSQRVDHWLGRTCTVCGQWWGVISCTDAEHDVVCQLVEKTAPPAAEGALLDPHRCAKPLYEWAWRANPSRVPTSEIPPGY